MYCLSYVPFSKVSFEMFVRFQDIYFKEKYPCLIKTGLFRVDLKFLSLCILYLIALVGELLTTMKEEQYKKIIK